MKALTRKPLESGDHPLPALPAETSEDDVRLELRQKNADLRGILEAFPDLYFWLDPDGTIRRYHAGGPTYVPPEEFLNRRMQEVLPPAVARQIEEAIARAIATGEVVETDYPLPLPVGQCWYDARVQALANQQILIVVRDITARKQADEEIRQLNINLEQRVRERTAELEAANLKLSGLIAERLRAEVALRESEERFRTIFEQAAVGMALVETATGRFVRINHGYCDLLGYSVEEMTGRAFQTITHPDDLPEDLENMRQLVAGELGAFAMEKRYFRKDGSLVWVHLTVSPTWRAGESPRYHIAIVEDITERKQVEDALRQSEERFRLVVEAAPNGMLMIGPDGTIVIANAQIEKMFGYSKEELLGRPVEMLVPDCYRGRHPDHRAAFFAAPQAQAMGAGRELHGRRKDGREVPVEIGLNPIRSEVGLLVLAAVIDISERKRVEAQLQTTLDQLHGLTAHLETVREEERTRIAREIHDELGQSLTILKFDSVWIKSQLIRGVRDQHRDLLLARAENMSSLIDTTIQTMRRIVTELRPSILDKFGLAAALEWQGQEFHQRTGIRCTVDVRDHGLDLDRSTAVFRIVQEALTNVARHAAATAVEVRSYREAQSLILVVEDNGQGIVDQSISARESFGLLGMRERAAAAGGGLQIDSGPERGTRIKVQVPLPAPHWIASAQARKSAIENPQSKMDSKS